MFHQVIKIELFFVLFGCLVLILFVASTTADAVAGVVPGRKNKLAFITTKTMTCKSTTSTLVVQQRVPTILFFSQQQQQQRQRCPNSNSIKTQSYVDNRLSLRYIPDRLLFNKCSLLYLNRFDKDYNPLVHNSKEDDIIGGNLQDQHDENDSIYNNNDDDNTKTDTNGIVVESRQQRIRKRVRELAQSVSLSSSIQKTKAASAMFMPQAVAAVLRDATKNAVEIAYEEILPRLSSSQQQHQRSKDAEMYNNLLNSRRIDSLLDEAFVPMEKSLLEMDKSLQKARKSLQDAKREAKIALQQIQTAVVDQATASAVAAAVVVDKKNKQQQRQFSSTNNKVQFESIAELTYDDIDYTESEMAPPFLGEDQCLVPGEPVVRVEKAPENSRRIFAGIDILASVDTVWNVLTDYANLQNVVPNLVLNDVLELYNYNDNDDNNNKNTNVELNNNTVDISTNIDTTNLSEEEQCRLMCEQMKGSKLRQVGGAKVAGIQFSARTTLEVREWPNGMPDYAHFNDEIYNGTNRMNRASEYTKVPLERYRFPRPFAISSLPTKDISMQSILNDDGEFRIYQGVWRMQPLIGCAPNGQQAMRLTYAVQISPRAYLPVGLIEGRIVRDLCANLVAIRDYVAKLETTK